MQGGEQRARENGQPESAGDRTSLHGDVHEHKRHGERGWVGHVVLRVALLELAQGVCEGAAALRPLREHAIGEGPNANRLTALSAQCR